MRICFFGDSFINGVGDDGCLGWVGRLCSAERKAGVDLTLYNLGVRGDTSADVRRRWRLEADLRLPAECDGRLVFSFGLNDLAPIDERGAPRVAPAASLRDARAILTEASAWRPTLMVGPLPVTQSQDRNTRIARFSDQLAALCDELTVPFFSAVPFAEAFHATWRGEAEAGDGVHPNAGSYDALANAIRVWAPWRRWFAR